jgi:hypothetical protein
MGRGSGALLEYGGLSWIYSQKVSSSSRRQNLFQISIQTRINTVGGRTDVLPSAPDESAFQQTTDQKGNFIHKRSHYKGGVDRP